MRRVRGRGTSWRGGGRISGRRNRGFELDEKLGRSSDDGEIGAGKIKQIGTWIYCSEVSINVKWM